ncbi:amylo-alpha-1,6-glucosidase, partial [bacterium]|nr:amylo-alpha-1,6-glucosidase [bacterium]
MMKLADQSRSKPQLMECRFETDNGILSRAIDCAATDISMLLTEEGDSLLYPYAGIPWFSAPFGRDGIITAYQLLPWAPQIARGVLDFVFGTLGTKTESFTDEEPGKVFHELRRGEMAHLKEVPFIPYFGSVDATPLSLILLHEYLCWTEDRESLERWWPAILQIVNWMEEKASTTKTSFLDYSRKSEKGLSNQGWKDSHDSIMHENGSLAEAPIRLCEVQAYVYRAQMGLAEIAEWSGRTEFSRALRLKALQLQTSFQELFWDTTVQFIVLALDGRLQPCRVKSSNMGHCLWGEIVSDHQAKLIAEKLLSRKMFSGHGVRTLS